MINPSIVIVEDETVMAEVVSLYLQKEGYEVTTFHNAEEAWLDIEFHSPDLVLLDVNLPGQTGFELAKQIRSLSNDISIVFLTGNASLEEKLMGFQLGGNDYITKPFMIEELIARVKVQLRRDKVKQENQNKEEIIIGDLLLDLKDKNVYKNGEELFLFVKEKKLLYYLANHYNRVFSAEELFDSLWGLDSDAELKTVAVHISNLRRKIEDNPKQPQYLHTVRGFGYKLYYA